MNMMAIDLCVCVCVCVYVCVCVCVCVRVCVCLLTLSELLEEITSQSHLVKKYFPIPVCSAVGFHIHNNMTADLRSVVVCVCLQELI